MLYIETWEKKYCCACEVQGFHACLKNHCCAEMCLQDLLQHEFQLDFQMFERRWLLLFRRMPVPPVQVSFCCTMFLFWLTRCTYLPMLDGSREAMGGRAKNIASAKDVAKVLRGVGLEQLPDEKDYMVADLSKIVEKYEDFLLDVCRLTPRPTTPLWCPRVSARQIARHFASSSAMQSRTPGARSLPLVAKNFLQQCSDSCRF